MAEQRRRHGVISKGMKVQVLIEEALSDVLVVSLELGSKVFRGILLDMKKRNLPHGIPLQFDQNGFGGKDKKSPTESQGEAMPVEMAATSFRHTYHQQSNSVSTNGGQNLPQRPVTLSRHFNKEKPVRNIRLRPRQTLCSRCKSVCTETDKGIVPVTVVPKQQKPPDQKLADSPPLSRPLKEGLRKRSVPSKDLSASCVTEGKVLRSDKNVEKATATNSATDKTKACSLINNSASDKTKASPLIKITIGKEGTVLKIPPRIHGDEVDGVGQGQTQVKNEESRVTEVPSNGDEFPVHKKMKKALKRVKERSKSENDSTSISTQNMSCIMSSHHKKHKRKHKHKHGSHVTDIGDELHQIRELSDEYDENGESHEICGSDETTQTEVFSQRPRLLYTWRQNKGLSPRRDVKGLSPRQDNSSFGNNFGNINQALSPQRKSNISVQVQKKEYKLRSRERMSTESLETVILEEESSEDDQIGSDRFSVSVQDSENDTSAKSESSEIDEDMEEGPPGDSNIDTLRPLMMKIQTHDVTKCVATDGRTIHVGDIVWGKIQGFPWWPGRVLSITVSQRDNGIIIRQLAHVSWFGSSTMSHIQCSDLYPFLEDFKLRYNRKKRGPYKMAIKQATIAAQSITNTHHIDFTEYDL